MKKVPQEHFLYPFYRWVDTKIQKAKRRRKWLVGYKKLRKLGQTKEQIINMIGPKP